MYTLNIRYVIFVTHVETHSLNFDLRCVDQAPVLGLGIKLTCAYTKTEVY
jgi:hypothetical protein